MILEWPVIVIPVKCRFLTFQFQKARNILEALLSADWTNQKTQRSFFQKADALFALALSKESPGSSSTDRGFNLLSLIHL